jgi:Tfp pilus assembly protein PilX
LILLAVTSLLAATSLRNASSTESIAGNIRSTELATQAADIALRHCELSVLKRMAIASGDTTSAAALYTSTFADSNIDDPNSDEPAWQDPASNWDVTGTNIFVLPANLVGDIALYKRPPECMVERITTTRHNYAQRGTDGITVIGYASTFIDTSSTFVITARGFGPEVAAADSNRTRPKGTVVWLQSHISLQ